MTPRPATTKMLETMQSILTAKRQQRLIALLWKQGGEWVYLPGWWHEDWGQWVADCVLTGGYDLPSAPSRWAKL